MVSELFLVFRAVFVDSIFYELRIANNLRTVFCGTDVVLPGHSQQKIQQLWLFSDNCSQFFQLFAVRCHFHIRLEEMRLHLLSQLLTIADKGVAVHARDHIRSGMAGIPLNGLYIAAQRQLHGSAEMPQRMEYHLRKLLTCDVLPKLFLHQSAFHRAAIGLCNHHIVILIEPMERLLLPLLLCFQLQQSLRYCSGNIDGPNTA